MGSKGSQSTTQSYAPNPVTASFASNVAQNGQNLPGANAVPGLNIAGLTEYQNQAISGAAGLGQQNPANPYFTQGNQFIQNSAQPLSATAQPIYNSMVSGIMPQIQNVFGQQQQQNNANLVQSAGGIGADRIAVGQGNLANQQSLALGQTLSGLQGQAYQTAATQGQLQQGAGALSYAAGPAALQSQITGYGAENAAGTQQQQQQQNIYNSQFAQNQGQYQNPFQVLQAQDAGLSSLSGSLQGTTTNTYPGPSGLAQDVGLAEAGIGLLGAPFTGGASLAGIGTGLSQMASGKGSYGGNAITGMPSYGGGSPLYGDTYGGSASSPLPGLDPNEDYGWRGGRMNGRATGGAVNPYNVHQAYDDGGQVSNYDPLQGIRLMENETADMKGFADGGSPDDVDINTSGGPPTPWPTPQLPPQPLPQAQANPFGGVVDPTTGMPTPSIPPSALAPRPPVQPPSALPAYAGIQGGPQMGGGASTPFPLPPQPQPPPLPPTGPAPGPPLPIAPQGATQEQQPYQEQIPAPPQYAPLYQKYGQQYGVPPALLARQGAQESGFNPNASSGKANGISQFTPSTAQQYGVDVHSADSSINGQAHYMSDLLKKYEGNQGLALAAYNWGPTAVDKWRDSGADPSKMPTETKNYVQNITGRPIDQWNDPGAAPTESQTTSGQYPGQGAAQGNNPYSFSNGMTRIRIGDSPMSEDEATTSRLAASPWMALVKAGLGTLAASGQRDSHGLPMTAAGAIGKGGLEGVEQLNEQQKLAYAYNRMTPAEKARLQLTAQQQQFEQQKPFPMGQTVNPQTLMPMTTYGVMGPNGPVPVTGGAGMAANSGGGGGPPVPGSPYDPTSPVDQLAKQIADYKQAPISGYALMRGPGMAVMNRVHDFNGDYNAQFYTTSLGAQKAFTSGQDGRQVQSFSTAISHLDVLEKLATALQNGEVQSINAAKNLYQQQFGTPAPTNFDAAAALIRGEITKAVVGARGALGDREDVEKGLNRNMSAEQLYGVSQTYKGLMAGQLASYKRRYEFSTHAHNFNDMVSPEAQQQLGGVSQGDIPPEPGARKAPDGKWYVADPNNQGKYLRVDQ
jgi:Transglycosylase SLT domain